MVPKKHKINMRISDKQNFMLEKAAEFLDIKNLEFIRLAIMAYAKTTLGAVLFKQSMWELSEERKRMLAEVASEFEADEHRYHEKALQHTKQLQRQYLDPSESSGGVTDDIMPRTLPQGESPQEAQQRVQQEKPYYQSETKES